MTTDGWEREWRMVQEQAGAPRPATLGCSTVSHARLGFCSGCLPAHRDHGRHNLGLEVLAWRLLALASGDQPAPPNAAPAQPLDGSVATEEGGR